MKLAVLLALAALLGLSACGAGAENRPAVPTESTELEAALPDVALVACEVGRPPRVETPAVKPQRDGVHLEFVNETGKQLSFSVEDPSEGGLGADAPRGSSTQVVDLHPGTVTIACYDAYAEDGSEVPQAPLEIVDQDDVWISAKLTCNELFSGTSDYAQGAQGDADPLAAAGKGLEGYMRSGDIVEQAGYPDAEVPLYRLVRSGEVLAVVDLVDDGAGGWLPSTVTGCSSLERQETG